MRPDPVIVLGRRRTGLGAALPLRLVAAAERDDARRLAYVLGRLGALARRRDPACEHRFAAVEHWCDGIEPMTLEAHVVAGVHRRSGLSRERLRAHVTELRTAPPGCGRPACAAWRAVDTIRAGRR